MRQASPASSLDLDFGALSTQSAWADSPQSSCSSSSSSSCSESDSLRSDSAAPLLYSPRTLKLTIWQDPNCPCCYIGDREMERALASVKEREGDVQVQLEYKPFLVDPALPMEKAISRQQHLKERLGTQKADAFQGMIQSRGEEVGIEFKFTGPIRSPLAAHRLVMQAYDLGGGDAQRSLLGEIHRRIFENCQDIGCPDVLSSCAEKCGIMSKDEAKAFLRSPVLKDRVHDEILIARAERGVTGVPFTVIDDKWAVSGSQSKDVYEEIFMKVLKKEITG